MPPELHSIYDLTTFCRKTTGDVPAKLVGASTTVVGSKMYLFGGRLVTERRMVADLYCFDLETYNWEKIAPFPEDDVPRARYFHSVDTWNNQLIVFGGMSNEPDSPNPDELCVLNDVRFFDIASRHWLPPSRLATPENLMPRARYAQLSSVTGDRLFIIGGQDFYNTWLDDVCVYDLLAKTWSERRDYPRHCGSYRSVAVSSSQCVRFPKQEMRERDVPSSLGPAGTRFQTSDGPRSQPEDITPSESLNHLPYSAAPNDEHPSDIYLYSNYNFTDVKRELELFSPLPDTGFTIEDRSAAMSGTTFPPGLRFPTGAILGTHLIIAGIYLAHSYQSFSIWVLDLQTMVWSRIDPGKAVESGSWFRGCLWAEANKFMIFGNHNGNLVDDYNRRLLSWDHVAVVDLEAFGIYQPPPLKLEIPMQELGLAALEEHVLADFEIVCDDGRKIPCSRKLLEDRWPWFKEQRLKLLSSAMSTMESLPSSSMHIPLPELPGNVPDERRADPRLTPRSFNLSEPYPITLAFLQYFYSLALLTPLQTAPAVLSQLLVLATNYRITHLQTLVKHAMHRALSNSTSVGVYEVATLCSSRSLQIRALKTVMSYTQKKPSRSRTEKDSGSGGGRDGGSGPSNHHNGNGGGGGGGGGGEPKYSTRPRGTSDARWATNTSDSGPRGGYSNYGNSHTNNHSVGSRRDFGPLEEEDQLFTLPVLSNNNRRHNRGVSVVSVRTENEINELIELMRPSSRTPAARKTEQMILDEMLYGSLTHPYGAAELSDENDEVYYPSRSQASISESYYPSSSASVSYESESESDAVSQPMSPSIIPYHLPRRIPSRIDTRSIIAPSLTSSSSISSSSRSSQASSGEYAVTPPHSPELGLPRIEERYPGADDDDDEEDSDEFGRAGFERRIGMYSGGRAALVHPAPTTRDGMPWPTQKSRVEWRAPPGAKMTEEASSWIVEEPRTSTTTAAAAGPTSPSSRAPATPPRAAAVSMSSRAMSPTPSTETVSPRVSSSSSFARMIRAKKISLSSESLASPKSPMSSKSPTSELYMDSKSQKAEEKRRKKDAAKARTEELARTLKARAQKAREDDRSSHKSKERANPEPAAMFGGVADGLMTLTM
ncbi:hypothetical protein DFH06DRAFT_1466493 [Mycena polygramma]|nr:hypothetical protein DFH06DRAFT_1466493 [Mycena polygramma]